MTINPGAPSPFPSFATPSPPHQQWSCFYFKNFLSFCGQGLKGCTAFMTHPNEQLLTTSPDRDIFISTPRKGAENLRGGCLVWRVSKEAPFTPALHVVQFLQTPKSIPNSGFGFGIAFTWHSNSFPTYFLWPKICPVPSLFFRIFA